MTDRLTSPQYVDVKGPDQPTGDGESTFDAIYEREFDYVWRSCGRLGVPEADLADAVHDVFLVLHRRWADVDRTRPVRPWLFGIARRVAAGMGRKRREVLDDVDSQAEPVDPARQLLWAALALLEEDRRLAVILHDFEGHSAPEVAAMLELPVNTVYSRLRLARADLIVAVAKLRGAR